MLCFQKKKPLLYQLFEYFILIIYIIDVKM